MLNRACSHRDSRAAFVGPSEAVSPVGTPRLADLVLPAAQGAGGGTAGPPARRVFAPLRGLAKRPPPHPQRRVCRGNRPPNTSTNARTAKNQFSPASSSRDVGCGRRVVGSYPGPSLPEERGRGGGAGGSRLPTRDWSGVPRREEGRSFHALAGITGPPMHGRTERRRKTRAGDDAWCESFGQQRLFRVPARVPCSNAPKKKKKKTVWQAYGANAA